MLFPSRFAAWTRAGFSGPEDRRHPAERLPALTGRSATYLGTFHPPGLVRPAGRFSRSTRRAVCPSKRLKTRQRYPWRARRFCAIEYARTEPGQPSRPARAAAQTEHPEPDNAPVWIFLFARPKYGHAKEVPYAKPSHPRTSPGRFSDLLSLALGAAVGALLADPMTVIHSWTALLDLLVFWR